MKSALEVIKEFYITRASGDLTAVREFIGC